MLKKWVWVLAIVIAIFGGVLCAINPIFAIGVFASIILVFLTIKYGIVRLLFLSLGSLFIFQSSDDFNSTKIIFMIGLIFVFMISFFKIFPYIKKDRHIRNIIVAGIAFCVYLIFSMLLGMSRGITLLNGFRDCSSYMIFSLAPIMAYDFSINTKKKQLVYSIVLVGTISTIFCVYTWTTKRYGMNISDSNSNIGFSSYSIPYTFFAFCCANALKGRKKKMLWTILSGMIFGSLILTGTRTTFGVIPFIVLVVLFSGKEFSTIKKIKVFIKMVISLLIITTISSYVIVNFSNINVSNILDRIQLATVIFNKNNLSADNSYIERLSETQAAESAIKQSPIVGFGSGYEFLTTSYSGQYQYRTSLDSPLGLIAKHGVLGYAFYIILLFQIYKCARHRITKNDDNMSYYYLIGFLSVAFTSSLLLSFAEDKGAAISMILICSMAFKSKSKDDKGIVAM